MLELTKKYSIKKMGDLKDFITVTYVLVDSISILVCKFGRARFHKSFKVDSAYGYCASKKETYYGFKLHAITTIEGFITDFILTPANIDDREAVWE